MQSTFLYDNFVSSPESFSKFSDIRKGIPLLVPADEKLFDFDEQDVFNISKVKILNTVYDLSNESYVGFKHAFSSYKFLRNFQIKKAYQPYVKNIIEQNLKTMIYITELKERFKTIGAFQTRNIPHFGHELIIRRLLEFCDHVVVNPVIGPKKRGDITIETLSKVYHYMSKTKYQDKISFKPLMSNMFYAGPREAMHHALIRQRLGFQYFTVGRDHAGADNVYDPRMASQLIKENAQQLRIKVIAHDGAAFCPDCDGVVLAGDCSHPVHNMVDISGSDFRSSLKIGKMYKLADIQMQHYLLENNRLEFEK